MDNPGYIALSRMMAQSRAMDVRAHNIANIDTPGFRRSEPLFAQALARVRFGQDGNGVGTDDGQMRLVVDRATWRDHQPGPLRQTGNPLDLAVRGNGWFVVDTPEGERLTRAGRFMLDADGRIVTAEGHGLQGAGGTALVVGANAREIQVAGDGTVSTAEGEIGRIRLASVPDEQTLRAQSDGLFVAEAELEEAPGGVVQGMSEGSNVNAVLEMTRMMQDVRDFQFTVQIAEAEHERQRGAVERLLRRV
jgi:flagellar basal-body rod protein FlgF